MSLPRIAALSDIVTLADQLPGADAAAAKAARARQNSLTKPPGSLGRLEELAEFMATWRGTDRPEIWRAQALVFAGNHGICAQGVNPYPQEVTAQMVANFENGGAAINQLSAINGADLSVIALELDRPTGDFTEGPAMSETECLDALWQGASAVDEGADILILGEMGIGNSTVAAALAAASFGGDVADWTGPGTGSDKAGIARKIDAITRGLKRHEGILGDAPAVLAALGGREQAAICGAVSGRARGTHSGHPRRLHLHRRRRRTLRGGCAASGPLPCRPCFGRTGPPQTSGGDQQASGSGIRHAAWRRVRRGFGAGHRAVGARLPQRHGNLRRGGGVRGMSPPRADEIRLAFMLLSRLPAGRIDGAAPSMAASSWAWPIVGLAVGAIMALACGIGLWIGVPPLMAALLALAAGALATGAMHEDGLADLADGFGGGRDRARKLEIMRDSRIGSYGVLALILALAFRASGIATLAEAGSATAALIGIAAASRAVLPAAPGDDARCPN